MKYYTSVLCCTMVDVENPLEPKGFESWQNADDSTSPSWVVWRSSFLFYSITLKLIWSWSKTCDFSILFFRFVDPTCSICCCPKDRFLLFCYAAGADELLQRLSTLEQKAHGSWLWHGSMKSFISRNQQQRIEIQQRRYADGWRLVHQNVKIIATYTILWMVVISSTFERCYKGP